LQRGFKKQVEFYLFYYFHFLLKFFHFNISIDGRCVLIRLHSDEKQMKLENPDDIPESIQTSSFQFLTTVDKSGMGKHQRSIKDENNLKKTLIKFCERYVAE